MQVLEINGNKISLFTTAKEMPLNRYMTFQRFLLLDAGIGADMPAVNNHFSKWHSLQASGLTNEAITEAENLHYSIFSIMENLNYQSFAFGCRVYQINDELLTDFSEEALIILRDRLSDMGLTQEIIEASNMEAKKKIFEQLKQYYPDFFPDDEQTEIFIKIKRRIQLTAEIADEPDNIEQLQNEIKEIDLFLLRTDLPQDFKPDSPENAVLIMDLSYMNLCSMLESNGIMKAAELPVLEFYSRLSYLKRATPQTGTK